MQRQEMLAQLQEELQESSGTQGSGYKGRLPYLLTRAANKIAADYKCLYGNTSTDLIANQAIYAAPAATAESANVAVIEIKAITLYDAGGVRRTVDLKTVDAMDAAFTAWRSWQSSICPRWAVTTGLTQIILSPTPNYDSAFDPTYAVPGGMTVEGIIIPAHSWDSMTAECPLPTVIHEAVVDMACLYRISQNPTKDNIARQELISERLQSQLGTFENNMLRYTQATRVPAYTTGHNVGEPSTYDFNPLNQ